MDPRHHSVSFARGSNESARSAPRSALRTCRASAASSVRSGPTNFAKPSRLRSMKIGKTS
jgi:hypothetical protein